MEKAQVHAGRMVAAVQQLDGEVDIALAENLTKEDRGVTLHYVDGEVFIPWRSVRKIHITLEEGITAACAPPAEIVEPEAASVAS